MGKQIKQRIITPQTDVSFPLKEEKIRKQVGILGGTFNPVHNGHLIIADQVNSQLGLDKICLMPSAIPPHVDEKKCIPSKYRLEMLKLALEDDPTIEVEEIEITRGGKSYTYDTMKELSEKNPDTDYFFIIGGDMVEYLPTWHRLDELLDLVQLVGVRRPGHGITTEYPIIWVDVPLIDISSSMIRKKIREECSINYLLPKNVINYIYRKGLYKNE